MSPLNLKKEFSNGVVKFSPSSIESIPSFSDLPKEMRERIFRAPEQEQTRGRYDAFLLVYGLIGYLISNGELNEVELEQAYGLANCRGNVDQLPLRLTNEEIKPEDQYRFVAPDSESYADVEVSKVESRSDYYGIEGVVTMSASFGRTQRYKFFQCKVRGTG